MSWPSHEAIEPYGAMEGLLGRTASVAHGPDCVETVLGVAGTPNSDFAVMIC